MRRLLVCLLLIATTLSGCAIGIGLTNSPDVPGSAVGGNLP